MTLAQIAVNNLRRRKAKMAFVLMGLVIGIATTVSIYSIVETMKEEMAGQMASYGANIIITADTGEVAFSYGGISIPEVLFDVKKLTINDISAINGLPDQQMVRAVIPQLLGVTQINGQDVVIAGSDLKSDFAVKPWLRIRNMLAPESTQVTSGSGSGMAVDKLDLSREDFENLNIGAAEVILGAGVSYNLSRFPGDRVMWQYLSRATGTDPTTADKRKPLVYFGSFQDLLGKDKAGNIKARNTWLHETNWDLVVFDEYHFGAWRESAKELFEGEDESEAGKELKTEFNPELDGFNEELDELGEAEAEFLPITTKAYLYLSGTPFKALATGEFIEEQIFNWTYTDEQRAKQRWTESHPGAWNPYGALPEMRMLTYQMPDELLAVATQGEFDEFDLNEFFAATGREATAEFKHKSDVQKWLDIIRGAYAATQVDNLKLGAKKPPFPYSDVRLLPYLNHSFWFLPSVASCHAMARLLKEKQNVFFHDYKVLSVAGPGAGVGLAALPPVREAIGNGNDSRTVTLSCGKLTTGVTVPQWSSILMLRNLNSPETYFQAAFRVQSAWSIKNPNGDNPNEEEILKPVCFVFDFAPTRALRQIVDYGAGLSPEAANPEEAISDLVSFLPVLAYDGSHMTQVDAGGILDIAMAGTSATLLARKWESALLVNVDNDTLRRILGDPKALEAVMNIEGFRALGSEVFETVINRSEKVKATKKDKGEDITLKEKKELSDQEKEYKSKRKQIQEKLIKFATRIPAFMYLTDFRENTLKDVITKLEPDLFKAVTGLTVEDFNLLVSLNVFNSAHMNQAVFAFRRYEDASLSYTGIESHGGLRHYGLYDTVIAREG